MTHKKAINPYPDPASLEMLDPDPYPEPDSMNPDPQHFKIALQRSGPVL